MKVGKIMWCQFFCPTLYIYCTYCIYSYVQKKTPVAKNSRFKIKLYINFRDKIAQTFGWPAQSPDLNPIENLWSYLDWKLKNRKPSNEAELFKCLQEAWEAIPTDYLMRLVDSMPRRCEAVIEAKGHSTKY